MFSSIKKIFRWGSSKITDSPKKEPTFMILTMLKGALEDVLFWKRTWFSLSAILLYNILFLIFVNKQINFIEIALLCYLFFIIIDGLEAWLKYKHRTTCLKRLADCDTAKLDSTITIVKGWIYKRMVHFLYIRERNNTKAFLLLNLVFGVQFILGKYFSGYMLSYLLFMSLFSMHKTLPYVIKVAKRVQQNADSDVEFEGLIPEASDANIQLLSIEPEPKKIHEERQSLDYWKPEDLPLDEYSDSSEHSTSLETNLSIEKIKTFEKDVDTSDSSDDEYIPIDNQKEKLLSTVEVVEPSTSWSSSAYNTIWNLTGAVTNMIYTKKSDNQRKRVASADSSDGFEIVDKRDLL